MGKDLRGKELGVGISQRKDGRYQGRFLVNGQRVTLYSSDLKELKALYQQTKKEVTNNPYNISSNSTIGEWFEIWFNTCKGPSLKNDVSRNVYYRKCKNTFVEQIGDIRLGKLTQLQVQQMANDLEKKGYVTKSIRESLGVLRECLDVAIANKVIPANPVVSIGVNNTNTFEERRVLSKEEIKLFLEEAKQEYYYEAYCILLLTGMRIGEFAGLQWGDIDFRNRCIYIRRSLSVGYVGGKKIMEIGPPKTSNSYRTIPFFEDTEKYINIWRAKQEKLKKELKTKWRDKGEFGDLVFTTSLGSPITRYAVQNNLDKIVNNINQKEITRAFMEKRYPVMFEHLYPHAFRHTFATRCFEKKMNPLVVQALMGHSNYATTISYTHVMDERIREETSGIGSFLKDDE